VLAKIGKNKDDFYQNQSICRHNPVPRFLRTPFSEEMLSHCNKRFLYELHTRHCINNKPELENKRILQKKTIKCKWIDFQGCTLH